ncbi:MAG: phage tail protein [Hyphomicrobiales bacterium]
MSEVRLDKTSNTQERAARGSVRVRRFAGRRLFEFCAALALAVMLLPSSASDARAETYLGQIMMTGTNFCPRGWVAADGQLLAISKHTSLFSLYGTMYGGDGRTTFGLPDLRGRTPIHAGQGPGLTAYRIGQKGGQETVSAARGDRSVSAGRPYLAVRYCIAYQGLYPSRN